ncbi:MFS transporter, partial [Staphylococcus chromogenes]
VGKAFGPLIGGILVDVYNMQVMFLFMIGLLVISLGFLSIFDRRIDKKVLYH